MNHWSVAVDTHSRNHPWARHLCADLSSVDPSKVIPGGKLDLLIASPECTHHSIARGGKPCSDQSRASAWHVLHWVERLQVERVLIENVREFEGWGPLLAKTIRWHGKTYKEGRPDPRRKGETFDAFITALVSLGYVVEHRVLNAADYGDATCRRRLFIQASRTRGITWPEATHVGRWRPAREVIDWKLKGESIFGRRRPLAPNTMNRIEAGLKKFGGEEFIAVLRGTSPAHVGASVKSVEDPLGTITAGGMHAGLCEPFILPNEGFFRGNAPRSVDEPLPTITAWRGGGVLVEPFIIETDQTGGNGAYIRSVEKPLYTFVTKQNMALVQPFIVQVAHEGGDQSRVRSVEEPLPTIPAGHRGELAVCEPFVTKYYGTAVGARPVTEPLETITAKDRFALVEPTKRDIYFRMLQPHELAAAMGFDGYEFCGTKTDQVKQIGNAVAVRTAEALCGAMLDARQN
ncbi:MAG: DNA cytosine methyltransferase [Lentisphaerota bacterium]